MPHPQTRTFGEFTGHRRPDDSTAVHQTLCDQFRDFRDNPPGDTGGTLTGRSDRSGKDYRGARSGPEEAVFKRVVQPPPPPAVKRVPRARGEAIDPRGSQRMAECLAVPPLRREHDASREKQASRSSARPPRGPTCRACGQLVPSGQRTRDVPPRRGERRREEPLRRPSPRAPSAGYPATSAGYALQSAGYVPQSARSDRSERSRLSDRVETRLDSTGGTAKLARTRSLGSFKPPARTGDARHRSTSNKGGMVRTADGMPIQCRQRSRDYSGVNVARELGWCDTSKYWTR